MAENLFDLKVGPILFRNPIALATMGGVTDSKFAESYATEAGLVILGGYNLDAMTKEAASHILARGREEFIHDDPFTVIAEEIASIKGSAVAINVRSATIEPLLEAAAIIRDMGAILELDAHCRQKEMTDIGAGQALLHDIPRLSAWISRIKGTGVLLSVKVRGNIVDNVALAKAIEEAGADILHVDAMKEGAGADLHTIRDIRDSVRMFLIGNNSVNDIDSATEMFARGADMVSVARGVLHDRLLISKLVQGITAIQNDTGWYNAPKHVCRGEGDLRGLAFCCPPVKSCLLQRSIKKLGVSPEQFERIKMDFARGTMLEYGDSTCFGSLVWCCKLSKPCFLRDGVLETLGISDVEYMRLKKELGDYIVRHAGNGALSH